MGSKKKKESRKKEKRRTQQMKVAFLEDIEKLKIEDAVLPFSFLFYKF